MSIPPPHEPRGIIRGEDDLASMLRRPGALARALGFARSLALYELRPGRRGRLHRHYGTFLGPGDLAFDVGAHLGDRTRCWRRLGARVVAVEPQPDLARWLRWRFRGDPEVTVIEAAAGAAPGEATLFGSRRTPTVTTLSRDWIGAVGRAQSFADVVWEDRNEVAVTTLDDLIRRHGAPRFCKIDVEGFEAEVLRGLSRPLAAVSIEYVPAALDVALEAVHLLERLGRHRFNVSQGEEMRLQWPEWRCTGELRACLEAQRTHEASGDIYARLQP